MAFVYPKKDPKGGAVRWMARIKVGAEDVAVSLRLKAEGTRRLAETRARQLQAECQAGALSDQTSEWLGEQTSMRIGTLLARHRLASKASTSAGWEAAYLGYIASCEAKDTVAPVAGSARTVERTKKIRMENVRRIARWFEDRREPFMKRPFTTLICEYIEARKAEGLKPNSLWSNDYTYVVLWGEWMHRRGLCERIDRDRIRELIPPRGIPLVSIPGPKADVAAIRFFRDHRHDKLEREPIGVVNDQGRGGINWRGSRRYMVAWSFALTVRGLGCRPTEASALTWATVGRDLDTVKFVSTKTGLAREVPILFEWVRAGLEELRTIHGGVGPVCRNTNGHAFLSDSGFSYCWRQILDYHGEEPYKLKQSQKCYIAHVIKVGFPPHVVAKWTGHTLTVQERHYCEDRSYLPSREGDDYGEFGVLSPWGLRVREHLASFANLLPQGRRE